MKRVAFVVGVLAIGAWLSGSPAARASLDLQKKAKAAGYAASNCLYCHNEKLPKKGGVTHNERGEWLLAEKAKRKAKAIDVSWLKDYVAQK